MENIIQQGAEATISLNETNNTILKKRLKKSYRIPEIDNKIIKRRTKAEAKIINKLQSIINVPKIISSNYDEISMEYIKGLKLSDHLETQDYKEISIQIGHILTKLHNQDLVHGDLTTSNMILKDNKVFLIDFGLGFHSNKNEDKAVDLHLLKEALVAKHYTIAEESINIILENYKANNFELIIPRIKIIEGRGRYKGRGTNKNE